jgi:TRAP-type C4-dicarboxylate transport system permease small subunit
MQKELLKIISGRILVAIVALLAAAYFFYFIASGEVQGRVLSMLERILRIPAEILYYWACPCFGAIFLAGTVLITWRLHRACVKRRIKEAQIDERTGDKADLPPKESKNQNDVQAH